MTGDFGRRARVSELDLDDYDQIHAMRVALEPMAMRVTVPHLTSGEIAALAAAVDGMDAAVERGDRWALRGAHRDLHLGLTHRCGPRVRRTLTELWDHSERYRLRYLHREGSDDDDATLARLRLAQDEHRTIFEAAAARDATACVAGELHHLQRALETVFWEADLPPAHRSARLRADPH